MMENLLVHLVVRHLLTSLQRGVAIPLVTHEAESVNKNSSCRALVAPTWQRALDFTNTKNRQTDTNKTHRLA